MTAAALPDAGRPAPFSPLVAVALGAVGLLAFAAFLLLGAFAPDRGRDLRGGSALSDAAVGFAGIVELLRAEGVAVTVSRIARAGRRGLLVLTPPPGSGPLPQALLDDHGGPVLIVLPKWRVRAMRGHPGWVENGGLLTVTEVQRIVPVPLSLRRDPGPQRAVTRIEDAAPLPVGPLDPAQAIVPSADWTPVLLDHAGSPVLARLAKRRVYVLADPDLLDTRGLATKDGARTALAVLDDLRAGGPVAFDVTLAGFGAPPNLLRLLFEPPLLGATLCGAAAGLLVLLMGLNRFGPVAAPERVHEFGKRALADNSAGLIALAAREPRMAEPYARLVRGQALAGLRASPRLDAAAADRLLDAAARSRGLAETWTMLAAAAAAVRSRADLIGVAARLHHWREGMARDDR